MRTCERLRFAAEIAPFIREESRHASQKLTENSDGSLFFEVDVAEPEEVLWWSCDGEEISRSSSRSGSGTRLSRPSGRWRSGIRTADAFNLKEVLSRSAKRRFGWTGREGRHQECYRVGRPKIGTFNEHRDKEMFNEIQKKGSKCCF